jgi:hydroxymethylpyrimidine pyrophosphatase-like HAD family hydrolase
MNDSSKLKIECPSCQSEIVVDAETGQVLYHETKETDKEKLKTKSIQELMKEMEQQREKAADRFEDEKKALKQRKEYLEKKFEESKKHVDTSEDSPPPHPFDYD